MSTSPDLYPLIFEPVYKDYIWGGSRIASRYGRIGTHGVVAESWEVSDRPEGMSIVANGSLAGKTLHELIQDYGDELLGHQRDYETFPLLIKIIDAKKRLSVQVHPDEESAKKVGGEPKTEMWYVLDADPGSVVYAGLKPGVSEAKVRDALGAQQVEKLLQAIPVTHGNVIYIPGGRVHAIGEGCLLLEIQQNSNTTYRVYDWGRLGKDGKPRELHVEQAMRVIHWNDPGPAKKGAVCQADEPMMELQSSPYFRIERASFADSLSCSMDGLSFHLLFVENGSIRIKTESSHLEVHPGTTVLIPANMSGYELAGLNGSHDLLRISLP